VERAAQGLTPAVEGTEVNGAADLATKGAAATMVRLAGFFGYPRPTLFGWGLGKLVQTYGWDAGCMGMLIVAAIGTVAGALGWKAKPHGYEN